MSEEYLIERFRPAGAGVNQEATSCRVTHKVTGVSAVSETHRSVHSNIATAMTECLRLVDEFINKPVKKDVVVEYLVQNLDQGVWKDFKEENDVESVRTSKSMYINSFGPDSFRAIQRTTVTTVTEEILLDIL